MCEFQFNEWIAFCNIASISVSRFPTSGRSTGRSVRRMLLYVTTIRSRFPVCCRSVSPRWYVFIAASGTSTPSSRKYFTSRSSFTSMGSKFTRRIPGVFDSRSSGRSRFILSFSSDVLFVSDVHLATAAASYARSCASVASYCRMISMDSSVSITSGFKPEIFSNGCVMRSASPRTHRTAPAYGGAFFAMAGASFCDSKIFETCATSAPKSRTSSTSFFSRSAVMISRSSKPSNESNSLNAMATVEQSSNPWMMIDPSRRSSSFTVRRNS